jgi:hypothetical protein
VSELPKLSRHGNRSETLNRTLISVPLI